MNPIYEVTEWIASFVLKSHVCVRWGTDGIRRPRGSSA
jgi:hypothetical protein